MKTLTHITLTIVALLAVACESSKPKPQYGDRSKPGHEKVRIRLTIDPNAYGAVLFTHPSGSLVQHISPDDTQVTLYNDLARAAVMGLGSVSGSTATPFHAEWNFEHNTASWLCAEVSGWGVQLEVER